MPIEPYFYPPTDDLRRMHIPEERLPDIKPEPLRQAHDYPVRGTLEPQDVPTMRRLLHVPGWLMVWTQAAGGRRHLYFYTRWRPFAVRLR